MFVFLLFDLMAGAGYWAGKSGWRLEQPSEELSFAAQTIPELRPFRLKLQHSAGDTIQRWEILDGPERAKIDAATGDFAWTPTENQGSGQYRVKVVARASSTSRTVASATVLLTVTEQAKPPVFDTSGILGATAGQPFRI